MFSYRSVLDHLIVSLQSGLAIRAATSSSEGIASSSIPASAFLAAKSTMPNRVSNVALAMWGTITHLRMRTRSLSGSLFSRKANKSGTEKEGLLRTSTPSRGDGPRRRAVRPRRRPGQHPISTLRAVPARARPSQRAHRAKCSQAQRASSSCAESSHRRHAASRRRQVQARIARRSPARARPAQLAGQTVARGVPRALPRARGRAVRMG